MHAIARIETEPSVEPESFAGLWTELFDVDAKAHLQALHNEFKPWIVLSTSWCRLLKKASLIEILNRSGLQFVADNLHQNWATPRRMHPDIRSGEISSWLRANPSFDDNWVIVDDELSGRGLADWPIEAHKLFIVMCRENVGLTNVEYQKLRTAFLLRMKIGENEPDSGQAGTGRASAKTKE
jgi:hypothetical protein